MPVPLYFSLGRSFDSLDRSEQLIVLGFSLPVPVRIVAISLVGENSLSGNIRDTFPFEHGEVVL